MADGDDAALQKNLERTQQRLEQLEKMLAVRHELEADLRKSIEWFRAIFDYAPDAYYLNDMKARFVDGNLAAEKLTGFLKEELIGQSFLRLKLLPPDQIPFAAKLLARSIVRKPTGPDELTLVRKDGTRVQVEVRTFPVTLEGRPLVLGIARDISDRKRGLPSLTDPEDPPEVAEKLAELQQAIDRLEAVIESADQSEQEILTKETFYQTVLQGAPDAVLLLELGEFRSKQGNRALQRWCGREPSELEGSALDELFERSEDVAEELGKAVTLGHRDLGSLYMKCGDGQSLRMHGNASLVSALREPVLCVVLRLAPAED